jgi:hypothetical protein
LGQTESSSLIVEGRNIIRTEVVERAVAERPAHDTIERQWRLLYMQTLGRSREVKFLGDGQKKAAEMA